MVEKVLVVGAGIVGLATARALRRAGMSVIVVAREKGSEATSGGAGGFWMPFHVEPMDKVIRWSAVTMDTYVGEQSTKYGSCIESMPAFDLFSSEEPPEHPAWGSRTGMANISGAKMLTESLSPLGLACPDGYQSAWKFDSVIVDGPKYMSLVEDELDDIRFGETLTLQSAVRLATKEHCQAIVNCVGLEGGRFSGDDVDGVIPGRGVTARYRRPPEMKAVLSTQDPPLATESEPCYLIPRGDIVVCGGSYHENDYELSQRPGESDRLKRGAKMFGPLLDEEPVATWTGLRPVRHLGVRLEKAKIDGDLVLVHNYGHGGGGWTLAHGCAQDVASLLLSHEET